MKKTLTLVLALSLTAFGFAQKIKVKESRESIGNGSNNALVVTLYNVDPADAEEAFKSFMKTYGGKRSTTNGMVFIDHALVKDIGNNTIDIYGKAQGSKGDKEIKFAVAFDLGGAYLNSSDHKSQYAVAEKIVKDFATKATKDAIQDQLKAAQKVQAKLEGEQKDLEKENKNLVGDIEDYKAKIKKAEDEIASNKDKIKKAEGDIVTNKSAQDKKKPEVEAQKKVVADIDSKLKAVE
jgi:hypothetical protein